MVWLCRLSTHTHSQPTSLYNSHFLYREYYKVSYPLHLLTVVFLLCREPSHAFLCCLAHRYQVWMTQGSCDGFCHKFECVCDILSWLGRRVIIMAEGGKSRSVRWKMVYAVGLSAHLPHHSDSVKGEIILVKRKKVTGRERTGRKCKPTIHCPGIISYPPVLLLVTISCGTASWQNMKAVLCSVNFLRWLHVYRNPGCWDYQCFYDEENVEVGRFLFVCIHFLISE